jgi:hypothetical protein
MVSIVTKRQDSEYQEDRDNGGPCAFHATNGLCSWHSSVWLWTAGDAPEAEVFNFVRGEISELSMQLAVALHLSTEKDGWVRKIVEDISMSNRDPHLLFNQVGQKAGLIPSNIVSSAFIGLWLAGNKDTAKKISDYIVTNLEA